MVELFVPLLMLCLEDDVTNCNIYTSDPFPTEEACMLDLQFTGLVFAATQEGTYIAGLSCLEASFLDEQV